MKRAVLVAMLSLLVSCGEGDGRKCVNYWTQFVPIFNGKTTLIIPILHCTEYAP